MTLEELNQEPEKTFRSLFHWLGVDEAFRIDDSQRFNVSGGEVIQTRRGLVVLDTVLKHWRWQRLEPRLPDVIPGILRRLAYRKVSKTSVDTSAAIAYLRPILQEQTQTLTNLLGREFPEWTTLFPPSNLESAARTAVAIP